MAKTPQQVAEKWKAAFSGSANAYKAGVMGVQQAPGIAAARAAERMKQAVVESIDSGRYQAAVSAVTLQEWQQAAANKGAQRLTSGAEAGKTKYLEFAAEYLPVMEQVSNQVKAMPKGTIEDALNRIRVNLEASKAFKARRR